MNQSKYGNGYKWCSGCAKFIKTDKIKCPICGSQLRNGPKSNKLKPNKPRID